MARAATTKLFRSSRYLDGQSKPGWLLLAAVKLLGGVAPIEARGRMQTGLATGHWGTTRGERAAADGERAITRLGALLGRVRTVPYLSALVPFLVDIGGALTSAALAAPEVVVDDLGVPWFGRGDEMDHGDVEFVPKPAVCRHDLHCVSGAAGAACKRARPVRRGGGGQHEAAHLRR